MGMGKEEAAVEVVAVEGVLGAGAGIEGGGEWCGLGAEELWGVDVSGLAKTRVRFREAMNRLLRRGFGRMMAVQC